MKCSDNGKHRKELCRLLLTQFVNGVLRTEEKKVELTKQKESSKMAEVMQL